MGRVGHSEELANAIVFIASGEAHSSQAISQRRRRQDSRLHQFRLFEVAKEKMMLLIPDQHACRWSIQWSDVVKKHSILLS